VCSPRHPAEAVSEPERETSAGACETANDAFRGVDREIQCVLLDAGARTIEVAHDALEGQLEVIEDRQPRSVGAQCLVLHPGIDGSVDAYGRRGCSAADDEPSTRE
jgi:hypothetical protein